MPKNFIDYVLLFFMAFTLSVFCQSTNIKDNEYLYKRIESLTTKDYAYYLDSLKKYGNTDFFALRMSFCKTDLYSPYDIEAKDIFKRCEENINIKNYTAGLEGLDSIIAVDYTNIKAHMYLSFLYKKALDSAKSAYHFKVFKGLLNSIADNGEGDSPQNAYIVNNVSEEYMFLNYLGYEIKNQVVVEQNGRSFDHLSVQDKENSQTREVYFNIDLPMNFLMRSFNQNNSGTQK